MAFQIAVGRLGIAPSEFWNMPPRHFWWLVETMEGASAKRGRRLPADDRRAILEMLNGNEKPGGFW